MSEHGKWNGNWGQIVVDYMGMRREVMENQRGCPNMANGTETGVR